LSIKIDWRFRNAIATSPESKAPIRTLVQVGRDLGFKTFAEGVETEGEMDHQRGEQVNETQGFLLSTAARPADARGNMCFPRLVRSNPKPIATRQGSEALSQR